MGQIRLLQDLTLFRKTGVLVIMIMSMVSDIVLWFLVSSIFVAGFMVAFGALSDAHADR